MSQTQPLFVEHRLVPAWWWVVIGFFVGTLALAAWWYLGPGGALVLGGGTGLVVVGVVVAWGRGPVRVDAAGVTVGRNRITWEWAGEATALDADATWEILGPGADPRAFLHTRPWLPEAVRLAVDDADDPHPYWLIGTRDAAALAAAMTAARAGGAAR